MAGVGLSLRLILVCIVASPPLLLHIHGAPAADFHQWCHRTTHEGTCLFVIQSDNRDSLKTSPNGFCTILKEKARFVLVSAVQKLNDLLGSQKLPPLLAKLLQSCFIPYYASLHSINELNFTVLNHETYPDLNIICERIYNSFLECESAFKPPNSSPLEAEDRVIMNLVETIAEILNINECNQTLACIKK